MSISKMIDDIEKKMFKELEMLFKKNDNNHLIELSDLLRKLHDLNPHVQKLEKELEELKAKANK